MAEKTLVTKRPRLWSELFSLALLFRALWEVFSHNRLTVICDSHKKPSHGEIASVTPIPASHCSWNGHSSALLPLALRLWLSHIGCFMSQTLEYPSPKKLRPLCHHLQVQSWPSLRDRSSPQIGKVSLALIQHQASIPASSPPRPHLLNQMSINEQSFWCSQMCQGWWVWFHFTYERLKLREGSIWSRSSTQQVLEHPCEKWSHWLSSFACSSPLGPDWLFLAELTDATEFFQNASLCCYLEWAFQKNAIK